MILRKTKHISINKKDKVAAHLISDGFIENKDFYFEASNEKDTIVLILSNTDNVGSIFNSYSKIEENMFLIRMAKNRWQTNFDIVTTFWGTIESCKQYIKDTFDLNSYAIKNCSYDYNNSINLYDLK